MLRTTTISTRQLHDQEILTSISTQNLHKGFTIVSNGPIIFKQEFKFSVHGRALLTNTRRTKTELCFQFWQCTKCKETRIFCSSSRKQELRRFKNFGLCAFKTRKTCWKKTIFGQECWQTEAKDEFANFNLNMRELYIIARKFFNYGVSRYFEGPLITNDLILSLYIVKYPDKLGLFLKNRCKANVPKLYIFEPRVCRYCASDSMCLFVF